VIARRSIENVERDGRRFRSWLLGGFGHHLANVHRHAQAARRGGGALPLSIEEAEAALPSDSSLSPDEAYDRRWAQLVLTTAMTRLREQQQRAGKARPMPCWNPSSPSRPEPLTALSPVSWEVASKSSPCRYSVSVAACGNSFVPKSPAPF